MGALWLGAAAGGGRFVGAGCVAGAGVGEGAASACAPASGAGCSGPLALGVPLRDRASSPKLMVYERNGGSSADDAATAARGAGRIGPVNNSGTNNTIRATRMIAPVSRSFTLTTQDGGETEKAKRAGRRTEQVAVAHRAAWPLVYPKPLECRSDGEEGTAHDDSIAAVRGGPREFQSCHHRCRELEGVRRQRQPRGEL